MSVVCDKCLRGGTAATIKVADLCPNYDPVLWRWLIHAAEMAMKLCRDKHHDGHVYCEFCKDTRRAVRRARKSVGASPFHDSDAMWPLR